MANKGKPRSRAPSDIDRAVGERVRELRLLRGLTLAELGNQLGISHQQLQKYETGTNRLSAGMVAGVAESLGVEIEDLFAKEDGESRTQNSPVSRAQEDCHRIVNRIQSVDKLKQIAGVLKALASE